MKNVKGSFEVNLQPLAMGDVAQHAKIQRLSLDKKFHGALEATSQGEMLATRTPDGHSGGYVAIERVSGTLDGKRGTFALQHSSTMHEGAQDQHILVVPGSGTDELLGLTGKMVVAIEHGQHFYVLDYDLEVLVA